MKQLDLLASVTIGQDFPGKASHCNTFFFNRVAMGRARLMFYPCCIIFLVGDQTKTSALPNFEWRNVWCLFAKSCWNINTWTMLRMLFSLLCVKYILFWFYRSVGFEENNKYAKNAKKGYYVNHRMRWRCSFHFRYVTNKIVFTSQIFLARSFRWRDPN